MVLATNIAETSVTIPGISFVVDPGLVKAKCFSASLAMEALAVVPISKAQARQRRYCTFMYLLCTAIGTSVVLMIP